VASYNRIACFHYVRRHYRSVWHCSTKSAKYESRGHSHAECRYLLLSSTVLPSVDKSQFDFTSLSTRGLTPPDIVQSVQSEAQSVTSAANSVVSQAQTAVSSAITAIETDLTSKIPKNCSLGTRYFCLGYIDNVNCTALPLNVSDLLSRALPASISYQPSSLESLDQALKLISFGGIEGPFILGIILTAILVIVHQYAFWKEKSIFTRLFGDLPLEIILGSVGNLVCVISFICPTIIQWVLYSKTRHLPFNITSEKGKLMGNSMAILCCAIAMAFYVVSMFWRKQVLTNVIRKLGRSIGSSQ